MVTIKIGEQIFTTDEPLAEVETSVAAALQGDHVGRVQLANGAALYLNSSLAVQVMDTGAG
jgi:hypothetical protein